MVVAAILNVGASFMNGGAGTGVVDFFHGFQVALMLTVMFNLTQFVYWRCKMSRRGTCWQIYQPCFWTLIATILVNIQPMLILIIGSWKMCCAECATFEALITSGTCEGRTFPPWSSGTQRECHMNGNYFWDESYCTGQKLPIFPTKASGWAIQILCTWGGFVFMFVGVMQATQLHKKLGKRWRAIRRGR
jgi:hypothetical protein